MGNLLTLAKRAEALKAAIPQAASDLAASVARVIHKDLVTVTPVDTSKALSNWQASLDAPLPLYLPAYVPGSQGSTREESAQTALLQGEQHLADKKPGMPIYLVNNAPYIRRLNEGYSDQEPAGFVERAVLLGRKTCERLGLRLREYV